MPEERTPDDQVFVDTDRHEEDYEFAQIPAWPKVVGTISIVLGSLFGLCGVCGVAWYGFLSPQFLASAEGRFGPAPAVMTAVPLGFYISTASGIALNLLLLFGGIMLVGRQFAARIIHLVYGALALVSTAYGVYVNLTWQRQINEWVQQNPDNQWAQQISQGSGFNTILMVFFTGLALAWPIFCFIWFGAIKKTHDDMTGGIQEPAA